MSLFYCIYMYMCEMVEVICCLTVSREITAELDRLTAILDNLHTKMAGKYGEVNHPTFPW